MQCKQQVCFQKQRVSLGSRAAGPHTRSSGVCRRVPLPRQHQQGQEAVGLSRVRRSAQRKEASELPSSKVKPFQQSTAKQQEGNLTSS